MAEFDPLTGEVTAKLDNITVYANSHYVTPRPDAHAGDTHIKVGAARRLDWLTAGASCWRPSGCSSARRSILEMMETTGSCKGIENYSRYLTGRNAGEPPPTLFEYLPEDALLIVDESHVTVPQIGGM